MTTSAELADLAAAHHVATSYRGADRQTVQVDDEVVVAVLAQLGVDASGPDAIGRELDAVRKRQAQAALPPTIVMTADESRELEVPATLVLEDGTSSRVERLADLPLGWHRLVTDTQDVTLIVAPSRMPEVPRTWGWMLQLYSLGSDRSWGMGDYGDLAEIAGPEPSKGPVYCWSIPFRRSCRRSRCSDRPTLRRAAVSPTPSTSGSPTPPPSSRRTRRPDATCWTSVPTRAPS